MTKREWLETIVASALGSLLGAFIAGLLLRWLG